MISPPARWRRLLRLFLPERDRDTLQEEMERLYRRRVETEGVASANRWYRAEVRHFAWHGSVERLRGLGSRWETDMQDFVRTARRTVRGLMRSPGFATVTVLTLGLGIGAAAIIFAIADRALLRPLPYPEADRIVSVLDGWGTSLGSLEILQREMTTLESLGGAQNAVGMTLEADAADATRVTVASVSPAYLEALQVTPALGRAFTAEESLPGRNRVVLLGDAFWRSHYGASPAALGQSLLLDGESHEVVGVLPAGFDLPSARNDVWRPAVMDASNPGLHWGSGNHTVIGRMAAGATPDLVRQELLRVQEQVRTANPLWTPNPDFWNEARVTPLQEARAQWVRTPLLILLGAVGVVLLVVCANVASLFLSRGLARSRDFAVRAALGAGRARIAKEQLFEVLVVAALGLGAGIGLARLGISVIRPFLPAELPGAGQVALDLRVLVLTSSVALLSALAAGALPAFRTSRLAPASFLKESARGGGRSPSRRRTTRWLVGAQLAAAIVLVTSAGLLARTLMALSDVDPGFDTTGRITAQVHLPPGLSTDRDARAVYFEQLEDALVAESSLSRVALASTIPFGAEDEYVATVIDGVTTDPNDLPVIRHHRVSPGYFDAVGVRLLEGRGFDRSDRHGAPLVALVDETFVRRFLGDRPAVGQIVRYPWRGAPDIEVVGVVGPTSHGDLAAGPEPTIWVPLAQMGMGAVGHATVVASVASSSQAGFVAIQNRLRDLDERIAVSDLAGYPELLGASLASTRLMALLLLIFAGTTLILGCVGVYGVAAFAVRERIKEIGVRMAIGAPIAGIRGGVLLDGLKLAVPGGLLGVALAVPVARALEGVLYGVVPFDPLTFATAPVVLALAALAAVYVPARRATQVDPARVLRDD